MGLLVSLHFSPSLFIWFLWVKETHENVELQLCSYNTAKSKNTFHPIDPILVSNKTTYLNRDDIYFFCTVTKKRNPFKKLFLIS